MPRLGYPHQIVETTNVLLFASSVPANTAFTFVPDAYSCEIVGVSRTRQTLGVSTEVYQRVLATDWVTYETSLSRAPRSP